MSIKNISASLLDAVKGVVQEDRKKFFEEQQEHEKLVAEKMLSPKQKKHIDKNKNGKIDSHDFELLRKEEADRVEQIDELSKKTLGSYVKKAASDLGYSSFKSGATHRGDELEADYGNDKDEVRARKRQSGIEKASNKLAREEYEQISEATDDRALLHKHEKQAGIGSFPNQVHSAHKSGNKIHVSWHDEDEGTHHVSVFHIGKNGHGGDYGGAPSSSHKTKEQTMAAAKKAAGLKEDMKESSYALKLVHAIMEARGRPRKNPDVPKVSKMSNDKDDHDDYEGRKDSPHHSTEPDKHIAVQLRVASDMKYEKGGADVKFNDGKTHFVKHDVATHVLNSLEKVKPQQRGEIHDHIAQSHDNLMNVHKLTGGK